ncbi:MAG: leucine-rich repeat protein [bacterium]
MKKKVLFAAILMMAMAFAPKAWAHDFYALTSSGDTLYYNIIDDSTVMVTFPGYNYNNAYSGYSMPTGALVIPSTVTHNNTTYTVTEIDSYAFKNCAGLTSVTIPNTVTNIGTHHVYIYSGGNYSIGFSFAGCTGLTSIVIPESVTQIGMDVFLGCTGMTSVVFNAINCTSIHDIDPGLYGSVFGTVSSITFGDSVRVIPAKLCWHDTNLTSLTLPNSLTTIGRYAFAGCNGLTSVTIPNSVTTLGHWAFGGSTGLTSVIFNANSCTSCPSGGNGPFYYCPNITSFTFGDNVKMIPDSICYQQTGLTSVVIPNSVSCIGRYAFSGCTGLTSATIAEGVDTIGDYAFRYCSGLSSIVIPSSVTYLGSGAFDGCNNLDTVEMLPTIAPGYCSFSHYYEYAFNPIYFFIPCGSYDSYYSNYFSSTDGRRILKEPEVDFNITVLSDDTVNGHVQIVQRHGVDVTCDSLAVIRAWSYGLTLFGHWSNGCTNDTVTLNMTHDTSLTAYFNHLTLNKNYENGSVWYNRYGLDEHSVEITASAHYSTGYHFDHWSNGSTANPDTIVLTSDSVVTAIFERDQVVLVGHVNDTAMGSVVFPNGDTSLTWDTVMVVAVPAAHHHVVSWSHNYNSIVATSALKDTVWVKLSYYAGSVTCNFAIDTHSVVVVSSDSIRGSVDGGGEYTYGSTCTLQATPASGFVFAGWSNGETANPYMFQVIEDVNLTAQFAMETFTVTVASADPTMGGVTVNGDASVTVESGETVTLTATANEGYHFTQWNDGNTDNPRTVTVTSDTNFTAYFEADAVVVENYTVTVASADPTMGSVTVNGETSVTVEEGETVTLTATANEGYHFVRWNDNDTNATRTVTVTSDMNFTAYFETNGGTEGIDEAGSADGLVRVTVKDGRIHVEGAEGKTVRVYDMMGREVHHATLADEPSALPVGVYLVKVGNLPARKVVVVR